jgi:signal transduction histidine kinase
VHKLVAHQLRSAAKPDGGIDIEALTALMQRTYEEFDRERRLTDRAAKLMEEELQDANAQVRRLAEQRLTDTLESMPSPIAVLTASHRIQSVNSAMVALSNGVLRPARLGEPFLDLLCCLAPEADAAAAMNDMLAGETLVLAIGSRWYLATAHRFTDGGFAVSFSDVTVLKERESMLAMARDAAESANRLKSQFLATMSHELRTPLNAILGFSEMIFSRVLGEDAQAWVRYADYAKSIHASGDHLRLLISEVLDLSKIDSGAYRLTIEACSIAQVVADSMLLVRPQAERGEVRLLPLKLEGEGSVEADGRALKQVLVNLLSNAVKFTPKGGEVEVIVLGRDDAIQVSVRDTGIGIADEHKKNVFEPFHQGDARIARRYEGTGLGLSIVRGIVEMHGGTVWLESQPNIGTEVFFRLPRGHARARSAA